MKITHCKLRKYTQRRKNGRGAAGKATVFGLLKRQGKVFIVVVENTTSKKLIPVMIRKIKPDSWVYTDTYRSYVTTNELICNALTNCSFSLGVFNHNRKGFSLSTTSSFSFAMTTKIAFFSLNFSLKKLIGFKG